MVGDDEAGRTLERLTAGARVAARLYRDASMSTTVKLRVLSRQQQLLRIDFENTPSHEVLADKLEEFVSLLPSTDVVVLSDYGKGGLAHIGSMIGAARSAGKPVLVDPKGDDYSKYGGATVVTPNQAELREVVGRWRDEADLAARAEALRRQLDVEAILLTRSEEGMSLFTAKGVVHEPAKAREVFDVSGAGDTVIATLGAMMALGRPLVEAMRIANLAAGVVVGKLGTAVVTPDELNAALNAAA